MLSGSRKNRGGNEYVFIDGKAMTAEEAVRIQLTAEDTATVPGADQAASVPGAEKAAAAKSAKKGRFGKAVDKMEEDGLDLREDIVGSGLTAASTAQLVTDEKRKMRRKYLIGSGILVVLLVFSFCVSSSYYGTIYSPLDVFACFGSWFQITVTQLTAPASATQMQFDVYASYPMYYDVITTFLKVLKYAVCGLLLAASGMLYQNAFRNPIAAPSMLGVSNGISVALLLLVMLFGSRATSLTGYYFLFSYIGGVLVLGLVMLGGKYISGKGRFNVVNMLLIGTVVSQLLGVVIQYVQTNFMDEQTWLVYYQMQSAVDVDGIYTFITLLVGSLIALVPVFLFRFRLNLISFSDAETRLLGVDPNKLRLVALGCGSIMILTAQVNAGQVAMISLVIPFVVRAVFGSEFRKQLYGNLICGAILMIACYDISAFFNFTMFNLSVGSIVSIVVLPLFVWMIAIRQRSWE